MYLLPVERKKPMFARRQMQFPSRNPIYRAQKTEPTAATPSEPTVSRRRSVSRKKCIRGKSNHGSILRQPCRYNLRGTCTRTSCEYWHPPECQLYESQTGCGAGDKCLFPHYKVDEQPNKNFSARNEMRHQSAKLSNKTVAFSPTPRNGGHHLMRHRCVAISTKCPLQTKQRHGKRASSGTREDGAPPQSPRLFHSALEHSWLGPCAGFGQLTNKRLRFS